MGFLKKNLIFLLVTIVFLEIGSYAFIYFKDDPQNLRFPSFKLLQELRNERERQKLIDFWYWESGEKFGIWHKPDMSLIDSEIGVPPVEYTTNSFGMRDIERPRESSTPRVMFFGDSFTEGILMSDSNRMTNLIEGMTGHEILNFGKAGLCGTFQQSLYYEHFSNLFTHNVVCLGFLPANDFLDMNIEKEKMQTRYGLRPYLIGKYPNYTSELWGDPAETVSSTGVPLTRKIRLFFESCTAAAQVRKYLKLHMTSKVRLGYSGYWDFEPNEWDMFRYSIEQFIKTAAGEPLVVFIIPFYKDFLRYEKEGRKTPPLVEKMDELSKQLGFIYVDMFPEFYAKDGDPKRFFLLPYDSHWSEEGNRVAAEIAAPVIKDIMEKIKGDSK